MIKTMWQESSNPSDWLISPTRNFILFFKRDRKSQKNFTIIQLWYCSIEEIPNRLKNTRRIDLESVIETWTELITNGGN